MRINKKLFFTSEIFDKNPNGGIARYFYNIKSAFQNSDKYNASSKTVLHLTYYSIIAALIGVFKRQKIVCTIHDAIYERGFEFNRMVLFRKLICCLLSDHIVYVSEATKNSFEEYWPHLTKKNNSTIYHYSSLEVHNLSKKTNTDCRPILLYVGNRSGYKNGKYLLEKANKLKNFRIFFVGGEDNYDIDLPENIIFLGRVSDRELSHLYTSAFALITTSLEEGFNIPIIEAQEHCCPVICSDIKIHREIAGRSGLFFPLEYNDDKFFTHLLDLKNLEIKNKIVKLGVENLKRYSFDKFIEQHRQVYET